MNIGGLFFYSDVYTMNIYNNSPFNTASFLT